VASSDVIEGELWSFLEAAKNQPVDPDLLQRVKNQVEADFLQSLRGTGIATSLARMEVAYEWQYIEEEYRRRMAVTAEDLMEVARKYFTRDNSVVGVLERER
jgi:predicted Zn-dependent peptidase